MKRPMVKMPLAMKRKQRAASVVTRTTLARRSAKCSVGWIRTQKMLVDFSYNAMVAPCGNMVAAWELSRRVSLRTSITVRSASQSSTSCTQIREGTSRFLVEFQNSSDFFTLRAGRACRLW